MNENQGVRVDMTPGGVVRTEEVDGRPVKKQPAQRDSIRRTEAPTHTSPLRDYLRQTYAECEAQIAEHLMNRLDDCPYPESLDLFLTGAYFGMSVRTHAVGYLEMDTHQGNELLAYVAYRLRKLAGMAEDQVPFRIVGSLAKWTPFPLLYVNEAMDYAKDFAPEEFGEWRHQGMVVPAQMFQPWLQAGRYFGLVASIDPYGAITSGTIRSARAMVRSLSRAGCPVILTYAEREHLEAMEEAEFFRGIEKFNLGAFQ